MFLLILIPLIYIGVSVVVLIVGSIEDKLLEGKKNRCRLSNENTVDVVLKEFIEEQSLVELSIDYQKEVNEDSPLMESYNAKEKVIVLNEESMNSNTVIDIYTALHEGFHAVQDKEKNFWMTSRVNWIMKHKYKHLTWFISIYFTLVIANVVNIFYELFPNLQLLPILNNGIFIYFLFLLVMGSIFTLPSEIDASIRAYKYMKKKYNLTKEDRGLLKIFIFNAIKDYVLLSPYSVVV